MFWISPLLRALTALCMLPTLCMIDVWQVLLYFWCFYPHGGNFFTLNILSLFVSFLSLSQIFGCYLMPLGSTQQETQSSWARALFPSTDHPFKTINLQPVVYLQDAVSVLPSSLIPDRNTVDVAASSLHHPLGPHWRNSWSICSLSRKQQEAGQQGLPTQSPGCNDCLSRLALIWKRACFPKAAKASNSHHNYLNFLMIWITLSRPRLVLGWSCTNSIYIKLQSFPQRDYCS